jgi:hypothetical protein
MHAVIRYNQFDPTTLAKAGEDMAEFRRLHAAQPGYAGRAEVEVSPGQWLTVTFWDDENHAFAARSALGPAVERLLVPLMSQPSRFLGMGAVVATDLAKMDEAPSGFAVTPNQMIRLVASSIYKRT